MVYLDATIANVAFPAIHRSFPHVSEGLVAWVLNGYNVAFAALLIPAGAMLDRFPRSRERFLAGALIGFALASLLCAIAPSEPALVASRALQGVGAAALIPASLAVLLARERDQRLRALAILASSAAVAAALGPAVGGVLVHFFGWRSIFLINLPIGALTAVLALRLRPAINVDADFEVGLGARVSVSAAAGVGVLALMLSEGSNWGWHSLATLVSAGVGGALLVGAVVCARADSGTAGRLLGAPTNAANAGSALLSMAFLGKILTDVVFLTTVWRYSVLQAGLALTPGPIVTSLLALPCARLGRRVSLRTLAMAGGIVYAAGAGWYALRAGPSADYLRDWLPGTLLTGAGLALALPSLTSAALADATPSQYGAGSAINATSRALGGAIGIAATTAIVAGAYGTSAFHRAWVVVLLVAASSSIAVSAAAGLRLPYPRQRPT